MHEKHSKAWEVLPVLTAFPGGSYIIVYKSCKWLALKNIVVVHSKIMNSSNESLYCLLISVFDKTASLPQPST